MPQSIRSYDLWKKCDVGWDPDMDIREDENRRAIASLRRLHGLEVIYISSDGCVGTVEGVFWRVGNADKNGLLIASTATHVQIKSDT